ncbi:unnamed protein product [Rotaria magnacalcarata]|uniref:TIR domain-containing protein n=2 Tax=Rotaria magnacalcarata TaxID=392030 RepID=A0A815UBD7_9BILA|nr:unnamed protein product [Rotaria magnacalcarata]CAF3965497.1 unnamed protein product [Rotaria magnacalcarata]
MQSSITEYCATIYNQRQTVTSEQLKSIFDSIVDELNDENYHPTTDDYCTIINTLKPISCFILLDQSIANNEIFHSIRNRLSHILNQWSQDDITLTDRDECLFREIVEFFMAMIKHLRTTNQVSSSNFKTWFLNESFFKTIATTLEDIPLHSSKYLNQDQNMISFMKLIESIQLFQAGNDHIRNNPNILLLLNSITKCLCSSTYIETLKNIDIKSEKRNEFENFILGRCPSFCAWFRGKFQITMIDGLCLNNMLKSYQEIYDLFLPSINDWEYALMESIYYMTALLRYVAFYPSTRKYLKANLKIIDSMLIILNSNCLLDNILKTMNYNSKTNLTDSAISFIFNLINDFNMLTIIKENSFFSKEMFLGLKNAQVDRVKLHALMILSKILNEQDIANLDDMEELTSVFMEYLSKAMNDSCCSFQDVPVESLLICLKAFIQHDEIKEEIAKQNYFSLLIRCVTQNNLHVDLVLQISLEIIWSLTFNNRIREMLINNYEPFFVYLKEILVNSPEEGVQAAAKGILWKLANDSSARKGIGDIDENNTSGKKYDIMISYSHSNKDVCHQIYQNLINLKYTVWLDFKNMQESTLESMANAIESSETILVCMSNPYKQSPYCQSEAQYAYTRHRHIIPLVVENKYRPDGWLGFICASKLYVDFTKTDFEQAFQKLISQIQHHRQKNTIISPSSAMNHEIKEPINHDEGTTSTIEVQPITSEQYTHVEEQESVSIDESNYNCRYMEWWTHEDILNFLHDKKLEIMKLLFENEQQFDGRSLYALYERCQSNIESNYQLLNSQLTYNHNDHLPYVTYIRFISEVQKQLNPIDIKYTLRYFCWYILKNIHQKFFHTSNNFFHL